MLPLPEVVRFIRKTRVHLDLTQADLARAAGTSQSLVAKLERGRLNPSYEIVRRVLEALDRVQGQEEETAADLMHEKPVVAEASESVGKALGRMKERGFSQLPVVQGGQPVGSLSESVILQAIEQGTAIEALKKQSVRAVMGASFPAVEPQTRKRTLVELLKDSQAVLVVREGRLVGVVTKSDLW